jgi:hypothetical protein
MATHRPPEQHIRHLPDKAVLVNEGVHYSKLQRFIGRNRPPAPTATAGSDLTLPTVFPVPEIVKKNKMSFFDRINRRFNRRSKKKAVRSKYDTDSGIKYNEHFTSKLKIKKDLWEMYTRDRGHRYETLTLLRKGERVYADGRLNDFDLREIDLSDSVIVNHLERSNLANSILNGTEFRLGRLEVNLDGSSLRGASFHSVEFVNTSARGADFTDAEIGNVTVRSLDVTDSNITREQVSKLLQESAAGYGVLKYRKFSLKQAADFFGTDPDSLITMAWLGEIQIINNDGEIATDHIDDNCHIPQWELMHPNVTFG